MHKTIAIVMSEVFLRRLTPALASFSSRQLDFRIHSIHRPMREIGDLLHETKPSGLISEWLPQKADDLLSFDLRIPHIMVGTHKQFDQVLTVDADDLAIGREAALALSHVGMRTFGCLGNSTPYSDLRIEGFKSQASDRGTPFSVYCESGFEELRYSESIHKPSKEMNDWLLGLDKPCGIFATHDPLGRFLCSACSRLGIKVPDEVVVVGSNNDPLVCDLSYPNLSSVSIPWQKYGQFVGQSMSDMLFSKLKLGNRCHLIPPSGVELRHSANHLAVKDRMLRRAMAFLTERLREPISIGKLCDELKIPRRVLERKFTKIYECTPWEMLCQLRVNLAKKMLIDSGYSVGEISELCGFNDPERMAVVFKRLTGKPPSSFRK